MSIFCTFLLLHQKITSDGLKDKKADREIAALQPVHYKKNCPCVINFFILNLKPVYGSQQIGLLAHSLFSLIQPT